MLLAGSMIASSLPVFAASTVSTDKDEYKLGNTVTITTDEYETIKVKNSTGDTIVWGVSEIVDGKWQYSFALPSDSDDDFANAGMFKEGSTYTVYAGDDNTSDTCKFKIAKSASTDRQIKISKKNTKLSVKTFKKVIEFDYSKYAADDKWTVEYKVEKKSNGNELDAGKDYEVRFDGTKFDDITVIKDTAKNFKGNGLEFWFKNTGTYIVYVTVADEYGNEEEFDVTVTVSTSTGGGGGSSTGGTSVNNYNQSTWVPGLVGANTSCGIYVQLNPSQLTQNGVTKNVVYSATMPTADTFTVGVTVDGVPTYNFDGYDPVYVQVPYATNLTDTSTLVVKDANGNIVPRSFYSNGKMYVCVKNLNTTYTIFNNPKSFGDVHHDWAMTAIGALAAREVINGVGEGLYDPDRSVTRAEFTKMIVTMFDVFEPTAVTTFADIDANQWYAPYIATAQKLAITNGYAEDNTFRPDQIISREEMSTMLYRAADVLSVEIKAKTNKQDFVDDATIQDYAKVGVYKMQQAEILKGVGAGVFDPQGTCTRAQAAVAIYNMLVSSMSK